MKQNEWLTERKVALVCVMILVGVSIIPAIKQAGFFKDGAADISNDIMQNATVEQAHGLAPAPNQANATASYPDDGIAYVYKYVVEAGDSYGSLVRKAINSHVADAKIAVSDVVKAAAEAAIVNAANVPIVEVGEQVAIKKEVVANAVTAAMQ